MVGDFEKFSLVMQSRFTKTKKNLNISNKGNGVGPGSEFNMCLWWWIITGIFRACDERTFTSMSADHRILMFSPTSTTGVLFVREKYSRDGRKQRINKNQLAMNLFQNECNKDIIDSFTDSVLILPTYVINRGTYVH